MAHLQDKQFGQLGGVDVVNVAAYPAQIISNCGFFVFSTTYFRTADFSTILGKYLCVR